MDKILAKLKNNYSDLIFLRVHLDNILGNINITLKNTI